MPKVDNNKPLAQMDKSEMAELSKDIATKNVSNHAVSKMKEYLSRVTVAKKDGDS